MRIRNAAIAGATALAVAFGGTTVASAAETNNGSSYSGIFGGSSNDQNNSGKGKDKETYGEGSLSSKFDLEKDQDVNGRVIFGSSKDFSKVPEWAQALYGVTIAGIVATVAGAAGAIYNYFVHGPSK